MLVAVVYGVYLFSKILVAGNLSGLAPRSGVLL
jgi:hypothetical protein